MGTRISAMLLLAWLVVVGTANMAWAVNPNEMLDDPVLEDRARVISKDLRCLVCQNQSIDDSDAPLARDLRVLVRERLEAGDSNEAVIDFIVARYGEFVLLRPRMSAHTLLLWGSPLIVLVLGAGYLFVRARRKSSTPSGPSSGLSPDEEKELERLLSDGR